MEILLCPRPCTKFFINTISFKVQHYEINNINPIIGGHGHGWHVEMSDFKLRSVHSRF